MDKANYGANTKRVLAERLKLIKAILVAKLYRFRDLYLTYQAIFSTVSIKLQAVDFKLNTILPTVSGKLTTQKSNELSFEPEVLLSNLSFSHFVELLNINDELKRSFYEAQVIKNNWSVRELNRAINTTLFERTGLSTGKELVLSNFKTDTTNSILEVVKNH